MRRLGSAELGATTFSASSLPNDKCGANGLPLTPSSIQILGKFQLLKALDHPHLCRYVDLVRGKHERVTVVSEHYTDNLKTEAQAGLIDADRLLRVACETLQAVAFLNHHSIIHRSIDPENILIDDQGSVKLTRYGMHLMTDCGAQVSFPVGKPKYLAPEVVSQQPQLGTGDASVHRSLSGPKVDVWSLGMVLLETFLGTPLWPTLTFPQIFFKILGFYKINAHPLDILLRDHASDSQQKSLPPELEALIRSCLTPMPSKRPTAAELRKRPVFSAFRKHDVCENGFTPFSAKLRYPHLTLPDYDAEDRKNEADIDHLSERSIDEVYYLWRLAGGDLEATLKREGLIKSAPPVNKLAKFVVEDGEMFGQDKDRSLLLDDTVIILSQDQLRQRLKHIDAAAYYPLLEDQVSSPNGDGSNAPGALPTSPSSVDLSETAALPLVIKEKDVEYQFHRLILYSRLLAAYSFKRAHIWKEARVDIPPLVRNLVWAALLEVEGDIHARYDSIDKETPTFTDRQIEVDIPRCHQYNELLSSPEAHRKFKRVLKAWVVSHPEYVYWQGLDSLCAPFLYLNFNDEALAFACLDAFIPKYLHKFFLKDNSPVIQEYLAKFSHLIAFHDPELSNHLDGIGFIPDLYAIPWFLTMYAHVFPLHKLFHLWDTMLLGNSSFPLCIGVAILQQLRGRLLSYGFNECILLFSDMPEIAIDHCVADSIKIFCSTPKSATFRQHARPPRDAKKPPTRPNVSYYSQDYQDTPKTELSIESIPVEELKTEKTARISAEDLIELCELRGASATRSPSKKTNRAKPKILLIDVRSPDEFARGVIPGSVSIPFNGAFAPDGTLAPSPGVDALVAHRNQVKVIVGNRGKNSSNFAGELVKMGHSKVVVLHKGIDVMKPTGLMVVPPPQL